jgi:DNA-binding NtrC family response regulator
MKNKNILISWIGTVDLEAPVSDASKEGAIKALSINSNIGFAEIYLINTWKAEETDRYVKWLELHLQSNSYDTTVVVEKANLVNVIHYPSIYSVADALLKRLDQPQNHLHLNLTSGTPAMIATMLLLGQGVYKATLMQSSQQHGIEIISLPFDLSLAYLSQQDQKLVDFSVTSPHQISHFDHIPAVSNAMAQAIQLAKRLAPREVPIIIQGQSGTGKEVMASAIHAASRRKDKKLIAVNCGAIPESLIESELFGHIKGAFTGANAVRVGYFEKANGSTLFLDEIGELSLSAQVKLLRVLEEKEVVRVGESTPIKVNVRIIAATHRDLLTMVDEGRFREDLFYRLAVGVIHLPTLQDRQEDIAVLADILIEEINKSAASQPGYRSKKLTKEAINFIRQQTWHGNIRELRNTLLRASLWDAQVENLDVSHLQKSIFQRQQIGIKEIQTNIAQGVDLEKMLDKTRYEYIQAALKYTGRNKAKAAKLLGLSNHQTLTNWMNKLEIG